MRVNPRGIECRHAARTDRRAYSVNPRSLSGHAEVLDQIYNDVAKSDHDLTKDKLSLMMQALLADVSISPCVRVKGESVQNARPLEAEAHGLGRRAIAAAPWSESHHEVHARNHGVLQHQTDGPHEPRGAGSNRLERNLRFTLQLKASRIDDLRSAMSSGGNPATAKRTLPTAMNDWTTSSIFTDLPKQLGLKLESDKAPVDNLVVERVEKPSEN